MISIDLTEKEAKYLSSLLKNKTVQNQAIMKKNHELQGFFSEHNELNGNISRKITNGLKKS
ncbi:hypothetical protein P7D43_05350 [Enterococcus avium]|uniref:Uncharacterized protein n=1 Tax=Enterococcus avium TaxID=33945 RepID=A0AAW8SIB6_ENTAV|nr:MULTISPECIES: hypothetical protein [Enterococcus]MDT2401792.1 hypothetical protein [Enterococcus avium]MDT2434234.1 hypothetical protein [Enterococcus avium]MDT2466132.1 hypothetical protein [Enterococcus avium]MDT2484079.1 hypothetical protein [Enterococcus avium]MDT2505558.1 hypothetical protein [Enterococcus avium]